MSFSLKNTVISATALVALVQFCPAPFLAAIPAATAAGIGAASAAVSAAAAVGGTVATAVQAGRGRRDIRRIQLAQRAAEDYSVVAARQEQNQLAWQLCHDQLTSANLQFSGPSPGNVLVQGMPPACMTLATVITGEFNVGTPVPQGSDSMLFQNLSDDDINEIQSALDAHP